MDEKEIRSYATLMGELGLTGLEITQGDSTVRLERAAAPAAVQTMTVPTPAAQASIAPPPAASSYTEIAAPMVGVFYAAPAENANPFVQLGATVKKGDVLGIIEAMKLLNEITADCDGVVEEICVGDKQIVEYGHVLFRIGRGQL